MRKKEFAGDAVCLFDGTTSTLTTSASAEWEVEPGTIDSPGSPIPPATPADTRKKMRPSGASPTQRSLKYLRSQGWSAFVVERWNPYARIRQDLGGFADLLCWKSGDGVLAIQTTTAANLAARWNKILGVPAAQEFLAAGGTRIMLHGWSIRGAAGVRKTWKVTVREVTASDFIPF